MWDNKSIATHLIPVNGIQIQQHMIIHSECQQNTFLIHSFMIDSFLQRLVYFSKVRQPNQLLKKKSLNHKKSVQEHVEKGVASIHLI